MEFQALVNISNPGPATSVKLFIDSIEPDCLVPGVAATDIKVSLRHPDPVSMPRPRPLEEAVADNPYRMESDDTKEMQLKAQIQLSTACIEKSFGSLSAFTKMKVRLGAKRTGCLPVYDFKYCDLTTIHENTERQVHTKITPLRDKQVKQAIEALKRYWGVSNLQG
jgi:hypothetical protein